MRAVKQLSRDEQVKEHTGSVHVQSYLKFGGLKRMACKSHQNQSSSKYKSSCTTYIVMPEYKIVATLIPSSEPLYQRVSALGAGRKPKTKRTNLGVASGTPRSVTQESGRARREKCR